MESQEVAPAGGSPYDIITGESTHSRQISDIASALNRVPLFADMDMADRELVAGLVQRSEAQPGDVLVRQDEPGNEFLIIVEGTARVETDGRHVARLNAGEYFGEIAILDGKPRVSSVIADTPMSLLVIQKPAFDHLVATVPGLSQRLIIVLCARLRRQIEDPRH